MSSEPTQAPVSTTAPAGAPPEGTAGGTEATAAPPKMTPAQEVEFYCLKNAVYHDDRERHFARLHKLVMFVVVLSGTAAFTSVVARGDWYALAFTAASTLAGVADLVFDLAGRARLHAGLKGKCYDLLARVQLGEDHKEIYASLTRTFADEPPTMHAANSFAYNAAVDAMGRAKGAKYVMTFPQRVLRHWFAYTPNGFPTYDEAAAAKGEQAKA